MQTLRELADQDRRTRQGEFSAFLRCLMQARGNADEIRRLAAKGTAPRVVEMVEKAVIPPGGAGAAWGSELQAARLVLGGFSDSLRYTSAFAAAMAAGLITRAPLGDTVGMVMVGATASADVARSAPIPVTKLDISGANLARRKAAGLIVLSETLLKEFPREAESIISREMTAAVGGAIDKALFDPSTGILTSGLVSYTSTMDLFNDARTLIEAIGLYETSRPFWVAGSQAAVILSTRNVNAQRYADDVNPTAGGSFLGWPVFVSPGLGPAMLALCDGRRIAGALGDVEVGYSDQALVVSDTAPTGGVTGSPATVTGIGPLGSLLSLWQENLVGGRAIQYYGAAKTRASAVAVLFLGGSPS